MKFAVLIAACMVAFAVSPAVAIAQQAHHQHQGIAGKSGNPMPSEPGQSAFAAIAEIVGMLMSDPDTDWDKVEIDALRKHLVDMNELTLNANAKAVEVDDAIIFEVTGTGRTLDAIRAMVPAHAAILNSELGWDASVSPVDSGVQLRISTTDPQQVAMFRGLGFFGIMATGAHHQQHHIAIARGEMRH